jgi:hypothetical protein
MPKPYDRVKNANNAGDVFIKTAYWTPEIENHFEQWCRDKGEPCLAEALAHFLGEDVAISFKTLNGSVCCTLAHQPSKDAGLPYLLTGWSDSVMDAFAVADYKLKIMLSGVWEAPPAPKPSHRR